MVELFQVLAPYIIAIVYLVGLALGISAIVQVERNRISEEAGEKRMQITALLWFVVFAIAAIGAGLTI